MNFIHSIPPWVWIALGVHGVVLGTVAYLILLERKVASWVQDRLGPNRVGPGGLLQPMADGLKFFVKEDYEPAGVDKRLFSVGPALLMLVMIISVAVIPWGGWVQSAREVPVGIDPSTVVPSGGVLVSVSEPVNPGGTVDHEGAPPQMVRDVLYRWPFQIANLNIGVLYVIAVLSLAVYGVVVGGWASNNKYSFLGGLRATAQMISYEIPLGLSLLTVVLMFGSLDLGELVEKQAHLWGGFLPAWNVFCQPLAFLMFLVCLHAEANRAPFDLAEAEQELVGGYHTEYSSMRFALFFLGEYAGMITTSAVCVALFFGGWHLPGLAGTVDPANPAVTGSLGMALLRAGVFFAKTVLLIFVFMWVRWSLPRFRFDQLMMLAWRAMIPLSLAMLLVTGLVVYGFGGSGRAFMRVGGKMALVLLAANVLVLAGAMVLSRLLPAAPYTNRRLAVPGSRFSSPATG